MTRRVPTSVQVIVGVLCLVGIVSAIQRTVIATLTQPHDAGGFTPIARTNTRIMARVSGLIPGTPRHADLMAGVLAFEQKYEANRRLILLHVIPGGLLFLFAPLQFSSRFRQRHLAVHRWTGRMLLVAVALSGIPAFAFGLFMPFGGWPESVAVMLFGTLFFYSAARGWVAIRRREIVTHREWMTRMFAVAIGIASTRVISIVFGAWTTLSFRDVFVVSLWTGFVMSVAVGEFIIHRSRPQRFAIPPPVIASDTL